MRRCTSVLLSAALSACALLAARASWAGESAAVLADPAFVLPLGKPAVNGKPVSFSQEEGLVWQGKGAATTFKAGELRAIAFEPGAVAVPVDAQEVGVLLDGGDLVSGKMVSWTREAIEIDSACVGKIRILMGKVRAVTRAEKLREPILDGVGEAKEWGICGVVDKGVLTDNGRKLDGPTRQLPLPAQFRIRFDFSHFPGAAYVTIFGRGEIINPIEGNHSDYFFRISRDGSSKILPPDLKNGNQHQRDERAGFQPTRMVQVEILGDFSTKTCHLLLNGSRVYSGHFPAGFNPGKTLGFPALRARVSHFKLMPWNGALPDAPVAPSDKDGLVLANGEREAGRFGGIEGGSILFEGDSRGQLKLPLARIARVEFAGKDSLAPKIGEGAVSIACGASDHLVLGRFSLKDGVVTGEQAILGACSLPLAQVRRVDFREPVVTEEGVGE